MPKDDSPEDIREELYCMYRIMLYKMFIHVGDYLTVTSKKFSTRKNLDIQSGRDWIFSDSIELSGFVWICDAFDLNILKLRESFKQLKKEGIRRFGYQSFCLVLLETRRGYVPEDPLLLSIKSGDFGGRGVPLKKRVALYAQSEGYGTVDDWIYEKIYSCGWGPKHFAIALEARHDNVVRYIKKEYGLKLGDGGVV